jgi:DNA-binding response OmpR family regulator
MSRILIIEDDNSLRTVLAKALARAGHEVFQASDGKVGVDLARVTPLDLVITDLIMPIQEGVETILILRKELPTLPIIAISGGVPNSPIYLNIAEKVGARQILTKPFTAAEMLAAIAEVLPPAR